MNKKIKIALLIGGKSGERSVSLSTGREIKKALKSTEYKVLTYDTGKNLKKFFGDALKKKFDLVFPALHGPYGEDGRLQGMLDMLDIPYVFSGCLTSALAMNKKFTKIIAHELGVKVLPHITIQKGSIFNIEAIVDMISPPFVVKPNELGSSVGISIVRKKSDIKKAITKAYRYCDEVMIEKYMPGKELTVTVLQKGKKLEVMPVTEIKHKLDTFYDYRSKYSNGGSVHLCPAKISSNISQNARDKALKIYGKLNCRDLARADFILSRNNKLYFIEINTIPGMTKTSLAPEAVRAGGTSFKEMLRILIQNNL